MKMYRAVAIADFKPGIRHLHKTTQRLPKNVPLVVDNIWEWLRPQNAPSRRHAVYASPTPELALANASSAGASRDEYLVCELEVKGNPLRIAHLQVPDARHHADIVNLNALLCSVTGASSGNELAEDSPYSTLYEPGMRKEELDAFFQGSQSLQKLATRIRDTSDFWSSATLHIRPESDGEMFFEVPENGYFVLHPIDLGKSKE